MMKKLIVLLGIVALVAGLSGVASADPQWIVYLTAKDQNNAGYLSANYNFGMRTGAMDGADTLDGANPAGTGSAVAMGCFDLGAGAAQNGYFKDFRSGVSTWNLKVWLQPSSTATDIKITGWNPTGTYDMPAGLKMKLTLGENTFVFDGATMNGASTAPLFTWTIPNAQQYKGVENALVGTLGPDVVVPEPASVLALVTGLVGLVGIRRRK